MLAVACNPGATTPVAGNGAAGNSGDGGAAIEASMQQPGGLTVLPDGGFVVVDAVACVIRKVDAEGNISTIAGNGTCGFSGDGGPATSAEINPIDTRFSAVTGQIAADSDGNISFTDSGNVPMRSAPAYSAAAMAASCSPRMS